MTKKQIRAKFRSEVFSRDKHTCKGCLKKFLEENLDAHHITDRNEISNGGYVKENGITLCEECHLKAEKYHISGGKEFIDEFHPNDLYKKIRSSLELAIKMSKLLN
jgi:5-methylcytosine-specific restriction endonuclease McrA